MAYAAADVFPVEVLPGAADRTGDLYTLRLASRFDPARAGLSTALDLEAPAIRLTKMLESDDVQEEGSWTLTETGALGDRGQDTEWRFIPRDEESPREILRFEGSSQADVRGVGFLVPPGMSGEIVQFTRRRKALKVLREHTELLRMLRDPRLRIEDSRDPLDEKEEIFKALDMSKQDALREILSTVPLFLLQGPPGVGKTYLVGDIVRRRFEDDPTTRMLLSAQSNAAIDHLMKEVQSIFEESTAPPVMVRARPADDDPADTDLEIDRQADRLLQALAESDLVSEANPALRAKVLALAEARREGAKRNVQARGMAAEGRAFEGMILRAANLVFATTNSAAVERLIEERSLFDWSIIEEAGKATGAELLSPLLLSHRRLMIGDHKQLPPYGADRMIRLLAVPEKVRTAITTAEDLISLYLKDPAIEELFDEVEAEFDDFGRLCSETLSILTLFETMVEAEFARRPRATPLRPIARRLDEQHRMHPAIATVVSKCFYNGQLSTNPAKAKEYREGVPPFRSADPTRLPDTPIVFVDLPYVRAQRGFRGGDRSPPWSNPDEVSATLEALALLRATPGEHPTIAVLSPYREQVKALRQGINGRMSGSLAYLTNFRPAVGDEDYCGTVDSFQGDQADLVLISMVRNNAHASPAKAFGFLRDDRRMNVLLSRAKWRMILVGSLEFYRNVVSFSTAIPDAELGFLKRFLAVLEEAKSAQDASIVPWTRLSEKAS
jgi:AAA domain